MIPKQYALWNVLIIPALITLLTIHYPYQCLTWLAAEWMWGLAVHCAVPLHKHWHYHKGDTWFIWETFYSCVASPFIRGPEYFHVEFLYIWSKSRGERINPSSSSVRFLLLRCKWAQLKQSLIPATIFFLCFFFFFQTATIFRGDSSFPLNPQHALTIYYRARCPLSMPHVTKHRQQNVAQTLPCMPMKRWMCERVRHYPAMSVI